MYFPNVNLWCERLNLLIVGTFYHKKLYNSTRPAGPRGVRPLSRSEARMNVGLEIFVDYDQAEVKSFDIYDELLS